MKTAVRVVTPVLIIVLLVGVLLEYRRSIAEVERRFGDKQRHLAGQAAERMAEVFREVRKILFLLGHNVEVRRATPEGLQAMTIALGQLKEHGATAMCLVQGSRSPCAFGRGAPALGSLRSRFKPCGPDETLCVRGPVVSADGALVIACSVNAPKPLELDGAAGRGELLALLDWRVLMQQLGRITRLSRDTYAWVEDHHGRLIMHPEHKGGRSSGRTTQSLIGLEPGDTCMKCHDSFELQRKMKAGEEGTFKVKVGAREVKLVAFKPFTVGSHSWSLAVATPVRYVVAEGRRSALRLALFAGAIVLVLVVGALLLDREAGRRLRAAASFQRDLEHKVEERTAELRQVHQRIGQLQAHHTHLERVAVAGEMASIVAHEIRTPLNVLSINAQVARDLLRREPVNDDVREVLRTLEGEIERVNALLEDDLLTLVKRGEPARRPLCINDVAEEALRFLESEAGRRGVTLRGDMAPGLPRIVADPGKLRQVLLNLLLNAIQAVDGGGVVRLGTRLEEGAVVVAVVDDGPGVEGATEDPAALDRIFKPFVTTKDEGTGLGLAICSRLVAEMKGSIKVRSPKGGGATFEVSLPARVGKEEMCP